MPNLSSGFNWRFLEILSRKYPTGTQIKVCEAFQFSRAYKLRGIFWEESFEKNLLQIPSDRLPLTSLYSSYASLRITQVFGLLSSGDYREEMLAVLMGTNPADSIQWIPFSGFNSVDTFPVDRFQIALVKRRPLGSV